jgi:hypothetical protein
MSLAYRVMTRIAQLIGVFSGLWLFLVGCGVSFTIGSDRYANLQIVTIYVLFISLLPTTVLGIYYKYLSLILMFIFMVAGLIIIESTNCFSLGSRCAPFTAPYFAWNYLVSALCISLPLIFDRIERRRWAGN